MTTRVMLDIETLGIEPGAAILSIGACTFDTDGVGETFDDVLRDVLGIQEVDAE